MKVAFRTDASARMGTGHIMRCLVLADMLASGGAEIHFLCRQLPQALASLVSARGYRISTLPLGWPGGEDAPQSAWNGEDQRRDAQACRELLAEGGWNWVVADHYGLDSEWESAIRMAGTRLLAIDDLGRRHECDLLLDQNLHGDAASRYRSKLPASARLLLGPRFALLRPEFASAREQAAVRTGPVDRLLVFMGGADAQDATSLVLEALSRSGVLPIAIDVVVGQGHPAPARIRQWAASHPGTRCHVQTSDMAQLLAASDLAVGAGGTATWERCCLGVPAIVLALAENQRQLVHGAARAGVLYAPDTGLTDSVLLASHIRAVMDNSALRESMSAQALRLVDGQGARRVVAAMKGGDIFVRPATEADCDRVHRWRNAPGVRRLSRDPSEISLDRHRQWFKQVLASAQTVLLIGETSEGPVGVVRFDIHAAQAEVSIYLTPAMLGSGLGPALLLAAEQWLVGHRPDIDTIEADALADNEKSMRLFADGGYRFLSHRFTKRIHA